MNSWSGKTVTLVVDSLSLEGEGVKPMGETTAVNSMQKLATRWASLKQAE